MKKYRLAKPKEIIAPPIPPAWGNDIMEELWYGDVPPLALHELPASVAEESNVIWQERRFIIELGKKIRFGLGWQKINRGEETPLPKNYQIFALAHQTTNNLAEGAFITLNTAIWAGENYPTKDQIQDAWQIARLEVMMKAPGHADEEDTPIFPPRGPRMRRNQYIKLGRKVIELPYLNMTI